jgi:hypothetical protein
VLQKVWILRQQLTENISKHRRNTFQLFILIVEEEVGDQVVILQSYRSIPF